jgi:hypothetical protein
MYNIHNAVGANLGDYRCYSQIHSIAKPGEAVSATLKKYLTNVYMQHVMCWSNVSWAEIKEPRNVPYVFPSNVVHKLVYTTVSEHFPFAKIIHPPDRCGISRSLLNSMIITQVLGTIKDHSIICNFFTQYNATDVSSLEGACNWHADCRDIHQSCCQRIECYFSTISRCQIHFRDFGSTSNRAHNRRPRVATPAWDLHIRLLHLRYCLRGEGPGWWGVFLSVIKPICGEKHILIGWAWLPIRWAWLPSNII